MYNHLNCKSKGFNWHGDTKYYSVRVGKPTYDARFTRSLLTSDAVIYCCCGFASGAVEADLKCRTKHETGVINSDVRVSS